MPRSLGSLGSLRSAIGSSTPAGELRRHGELYHFSEDPAIARFVPHVPRTNPGQPARVYAIDAEHEPLYWFPRDCPRVTVWADDAAQREVLAARFVTSARRLHAMESAWLGRLRAVELYRYTFDPAPFRPWEEADGQWVSGEAVEPLRVEPCGDLFHLHAQAGIELRLVPDLWPLRDAVVTSGLPFSIVRMANAASGSR
jgi:hypothetical protein